MQKQIQYQQRRHIERSVEPELYDDTAEQRRACAQRLAELGIETEATLEEIDQVLLAGNELA